MRHMTKMVALLLGLLLAASNVMADKAPPREDPKPEPKPKEEPAQPWTVEQIRKMWADGISFEFALTSDGKPDGGMKLEVEKVTDKGFVGVTVSISADGDEKVEKEKEKTWEQYMDEFKARLKGATITEEEIEVPNGKYAAKRYAMAAASMTANYWFSSEVPGMFIKAENRTTRDGKEIVQSWELVDIDVPMVRLPWTRKQIIESWKNGVKIAYAVAAGEETGLLALEITGADLKGFSATMTEEVNGKKKSDTETTKWNEYLSEISAPRKDAKVSEETIETPAGKFECVVITRVNEHEKMKRTTSNYVAKNEPGLLVKQVKIEEWPDRKETETVTLTEFKKGK